MAVDIEKLNGMGITIGDAFWSGAAGTDISVNYSATLTEPLKLLGMMDVDTKDKLARAQAEDEQSETETWESNSAVGNLVENFVQDNIYAGPNGDEYKLRDFGFVFTECYVD